VVVKEESLVRKNRRIRKKKGAKPRSSDDNRAPADSVGTKNKRTEKKVKGRGPGRGEQAGRMTRPSPRPNGCKKNRETQQKGKGRRPDGPRWPIPASMRQGVKEKGKRGGVCHGETGKKR